MGCGSGGTDGVALLSGAVGRSQTMNQVFDQLGKIPRALLVAERNDVRLPALFDLCQPVFDDQDAATLKYSRHSFLGRRGSVFTSEQLVADEISEYLGLEWFHNDVVRFQKDGVHSALHVGVAADQQG